MYFLYVGLSSEFTFSGNYNGCGVLNKRSGSALKELYTYQSLKISVKEFDLLLISESTSKISYEYNVFPSPITYATY